MSFRMVPRLFVALLIVWCGGSHAQAPGFSTFPVSTIYSDTPHAPRLDTKQARLFRTVLSAQASRGPNFAGHFTVALWGCGAACVSWAILDAKTGAVWMAPFTVSTGSCTGTAEYCGPSIDYQLNSELLVIRGSLHEEQAGLFYFRWHDGKLVPVRAAGRLR